MHFPDQIHQPFELKAYLSERQALVEVALDASLPIQYPETLYESMRYSLLAGGKRLRPILCIASCELAGGTVEMAMPTACALEMIHTMSLIHDDLPAMDNDDVRRGKPTNHKLFGDAIAILAGDALWAYAFEWIAQHTHGVPAERVVQVIAQIGRAIGATGLVGGQVADLDAEGRTDVSVDELNFIHTHKTGVLLEASVVSGALLAGAPEADLKRLGTYAKRIGLAFQIMDDILDITATDQELGKTAGKDLQAQKATYPSLWGLAESEQQAKQLVADAKHALECFGEAVRPLVALADFIVDRRH
jgi:geranylgeranyl diphosphate synthase, type II